METAALVFYVVVMGATAIACIVGAVYFFRRGLDERRRRLGKDELN